ncbi:MAG: peroxiredoxin [Stellaceae bacterium]
MTLRLNQIAPDFTQDSTEGPIHFHEWLGNSWGLLFSHPKDFTPVCTTELGAVANLKPEFDKRGVKAIGLSVDSVTDHKNWAGDIRDVGGNAPNYPMLADADFKVSKLYDMLPESASGDPAKRTPADNLTVRNVFVIDPDKKIRLILVYPMGTGRNFQEILRAIDSLQLGDKYKISTPSDWKQGDDVIIGGAVSDEQAKTLFPKGFKKVKPYIRITPQP